eukprot:TRINITY_DN5774_c0_g1_i3.p1 TRINITY_DN5774_c0_g1~~TRINITY_DN5774_c0_g1_i3.p1  ORF type:complete len:257 (+),score=59.95 TRINITY_DN5774_c0_g1_i3:171-941(+)
MDMNIKPFLDVDTIIVGGQCYSIKHSGMVDRAICRIVTEMQKKGNLTEEKQERLRSVKNLQELYEVSSIDFEIVLPVLAEHTGLFLHGPCLSLRKVSELEGFIFSMKMRNSDFHWQEYDQELTQLFEELTTVAHEPTLNLDKITDLILTIVYYWYNLMALSCANDTCGLIALVALFLGVGVKINSIIPSNVLVYWEAILSAKPAEFISRMRPWILPSLSRINTKELDELPRLRSTHVTPRNIITIFNCEDENSEII